MAQSRTAASSPISVLELTIPIPALIKRNTVLLAFAQAFVGVGNQLIPALGSIMIVQLMGTATLSGIATSILGLSRFAVAYPIGKITDTLGRKTGLVSGLILSFIGAVGAGLAMAGASLPLFLASVIVFGLGVGAGQQLRLAAADMYLPSRRAEGLGYVLTGTVVGVFGGTVLVSIGQALSPRLGIDPLALCWFLVPFTLAPCLLLVYWVRPDPRDIALHLAEYYPGYQAPDFALDRPQNAIGLQSLFRYYPNQVALVCNFLSWGNMNMIMAMTGLALSRHGYELPIVSLAVSIHAFGMFGLSLPLGHLADRIGRRNVNLAGVILSAIGAFLVPMGQEFWGITLGTFMVGLGWSCVNVAATALIVDNTGPLERGRAIGLNDALGAGAAFIFALVAGPMVQFLGFPSVGMLGLAMMLPAVVLLLRLSETQPGHYAH